MLLLLAMCAIHFALGQQYVGGSGRESTPQLPTTFRYNGDQARGPVQAPEFPAGYLYYQYDNAATEPPLGIGSQRFEPTMSALSDQAADDFVLVQQPNRLVILVCERDGRIFRGGRTGVVVQRFLLHKWCGQSARDVDRRVSQPTLQWDAS
jgi:hypothetical protein